MPKPFPRDSDTYSANPPVVPEPIDYIAALLNMLKDKGIDIDPDELQAKATEMRKVYNQTLIDFWRKRTRDAVHVRGDNDGQT